MRLFLLGGITGTFLGYAFVIYGHPTASVWWNGTDSLLDFWWQLYSFESGHRNISIPKLFVFDVIKAGFFGFFPGALLLPFLFISFAIAIGKAVLLLK